MIDISDLEIRKLTYGQICELAEILEIDDGWKKLMDEIRSDCFNLQDEKKKYNINDITAIENASVSFHRPCSEIFLDEWGTSGRRRPTVRLLHQYLKKVNLKRAMSYVAERLLREPESEEISSTIDATDPQGSLTSSTQERSTIPIGGDEDMSYSGVTKVSYRVLERITNQFDDERRVGHGAFGSVYRGQEDEHEMAIKVLNKDATEHFEHELLILLTGIKHENLLPPLAISDEYDLCLVYQFMPNGSLEDRLMLKNPELPPLSWRKRMTISMNVCEGLKYLHEQPKPIIHRDIKSSNILLDENDIAKIGDFGLIRMKNDAHTVNTNLVQGTNAYMAPEYFRGVISLKLDVFSFGVILLELLTGLSSVGPDGHIVEYVDEEIGPDGSIEPLLDKNAGQWDISVANKLYDLAKQCLEEKKKRLQTTDVLAVLQELNQAIN